VNVYGVTVHFDTITAKWCVITDEGDVIRADFESDAAAWQWVDDHCDQKIEDTHQRISNAIRNW
jgi:hypothetical protein